jgi:transposase
VQNPIPHDTALHRHRHRIETMFEKLKDWRRIAMRDDRCAHTFFVAITSPLPSGSCSISGS